MSCRIQFLPDQAEICVPDGTLLSDAAKSAGVFIDSPCGGNGTCGKCAVLLTRGGKTERVLACQTIVTQDCTITQERAGKLETLRDGTERNVTFAPYPNIVQTIYPARALPRLTSARRASCAICWMAKQASSSPPAACKTRSQPTARM